MDLVRRLMEKGVHVTCPETVEIGDDVSLERISGNGVTIHAGCKIFGPETLLMDHVELGYEAPVTIQNCQLGRGVNLKGGGFYESTFLKNAGMGSGANIREGCLLEEGAKGAHTVGLKQTILFPFVTLGSLINFCDCLMAGGTDEKNHSEVGSSYIHFNYTPNQDKATPSLLGDVPRGVMVNQDPIFLGGQGGLVGPVQIEYGTIIAAGTIARKDMRHSGTMLLGHPALSKTMPFHRGLYGNLKRIVQLNTNYISNLIALRRWYLDVRSTFVGEDDMPPPLHRGALDKLDMAIEERIKRLGDVAGRMPRSIALYRKISGERASEKTISRKQEFYDRWPDMARLFKQSLDNPGDPAGRDGFLEIIDGALKRDGKDYIRIIQGLNDKEVETGVSWLQGLIDEINRQAWALVPGMGIK